MSLRRRAHVEVFMGHGRKPWRYRIVAANGEITEQSQAYSSKAHAVREAKTKSLPIVLVDPSKGRDWD